MKKIFETFFYIILYGVGSVFMGFWIAVFWKPDFSTVKEEVHSKEIGRNIIISDTTAEFCQKKNWFSRDYYIKCKNLMKMYYVGHGVFWTVSYQIKEVPYEPEITDECVSIK